MSDTVYDSSLTAKRIASRKWILMASCILAAAADLFVIAALAAGGYNAAYFIYPCILFALDALFTVMAAFSNFRFRYSVLWVTVYLVLSAVLMVCTLFADMGVGGSATIVTNAALISWAAVHVLVLAAVLISAFYAAKLKNLARSGAAAACFGLLLIAVCLYAVFIFRSGFFGQGFGGGVRTLAYTFNEEENYYEVTGVLDGRGDTVVVPETFNGKEVGAIDCAVLSADGVNAVRFEGSADLLFNNASALSAGSSVALYADKEYIDDFRTTFYSLSEGEGGSGALNAANSFRPQGLAEGEIYVTFRYSESSYDIAEHKVFSTWFGKSGDTFDLSSYVSEFFYAAHTDKTSAEDLHWGFTEFGGYIMGEPDGGSGSIVGSVLTDSVNGAEIEFEKIYRVEIGEDNDALYETDSDYKQTSVGGQTLSYRYVVPSTADSLIGELPARQGFAVTWEYQAESGREALPNDSLQELLGARAADGSDVTVYPVWKIEWASVSISAGGSFSFVYGETVTLVADAAASAEGLVVTYSWTALGETEAGSGSTYPLGTPVPSQSGAYGVEVTFSSETLTSLTATAYAEETITVGKKPIEFVWSLPEDLVYSGTEKAVSAQPAEDQAVGSDRLDGYTLSQTQVFDAGDYTITLSLTGETAEKYTVTAGSASRSFTVSPRAVSVSWSNCEVVYDGNGQRPAASASGVGSDGALTVYVYADGWNQTRTDAGKYTARAVITDDNYTLENPTHEFVISPRTVTGISWSDGALTYNGQLQYPEAVSVTGAVAEDEAELLGSFVYKITAGDGVNAGEHTVTASLPEGGNYVFAEGLGSHSYTIDARPITVSEWGSQPLYYNGEQQYPAALRLSGVVSGEEDDVLADITYSVTEGDGVNAGTHTVTASLPEGGNYVFAEGLGSHSYTIDARPITVSEWGSQPLYYNGEQQYPAALRLSGVVSGEEDDVLADITYSVTEGDGVNAGTHTVTASLPEGGNYVFGSAQSHEYEISKFPVATIAWAEGQTFVYDGTERSIRVLTAGSVPDEFFDDLEYSGAASDVGTHTMRVSLKEGSNFEITAANVTCEYTITPLGVSLVWQENRNFTYDGSQKSLAVTGAEYASGGGALSGTLWNELQGDLEYVGAAAEAGEHIMTASLGQGSNFTIEENASCTFTIAPKSVSLTWENGEEHEEFVYNGSPQAPRAVCGESGATVFYEYFGENGEKLDGAPSEAGAYTVRAYVSGNYTGSIEKTFSIVMPTEEGGEEQV